MVAGVRYKLQLQIQMERYATDLMGQSAGGG
jgi:hypothetical protein